MTLIDFRTPNCHQRFSINLPIVSFSGCSQTFDFSTLLLYQTLHSVCFQETEYDGYIDLPLNEKSDFE